MLTNIITSTAQTVGDSHPLNKSLKQQASVSIELCSVFKALANDSPEKIFLLKFWLRMAEIYHQFWTNAQGELPTDVWVRVLLKIGETATKEAIGHFIKQGHKYPPTLPEFYAATYRYRLDPVRFFFAWPRPPSNPVKVKAHLATIKAALSGA